VLVLAALLDERRRADRIGHESRVFVVGQLVILLVVDDSDGDGQRRIVQTRQLIDPRE
jgi:hypothetical protein